MPLREASDDARKVEVPVAPATTRCALPLWILASITSMIALSLGSRFFVPLTLGVILAAVLHPIVAFLRRLHVPQVFAAAIAVLTALIVLALAIVLFNAPVRAMRAEIPKTLMTVRGRLGSLGIPLPGAGPTQSTAPGPSPSPKTDGSTPASGIGQTITRAFGVTAAVVFALVEILLLAFFILAAGNAWRQKLRTASHPQRGERALDTVIEIRRVVLRYLFVNVVINAAQGVLVAVVVWPLGYPSPVLWGALTFIAEFIPYFGGVAMIGLLFLVGLADGHGFAHASIAPIAYLVITTLQNNLVSPSAFGRSLRLNPTSILAGVMFWGLIWGVAGVFLAVPMLAAMRIIAERADGLASVAVFLGD